MSDPKGSLLIVDDEAAMLRIISRLLIAEGYEVETADDGSAAVALLSTKCPRRTNAIAHVARNGIPHSDR